MALVRSPAITRQIYLTWLDIGFGYYTSGPPKPGSSESQRAVAGAVAVAVAGGGELNICDLRRVLRLPEARHDTVPSESGSIGDPCVIGLRVHV